MSSFAPSWLTSANIAKALGAPAASTTPINNLTTAAPVMGPVAPTSAQMDAAVAATNARLASAAGNTAGTGTTSVSNVATPGFTVSGTPASTPADLSSYYGNQIATKTSLQKNLPGANVNYFSNIDKATGLPVLDQTALDKLLGKSNTLDSSKYRENYDKFGWNVKSDASGVKRGAAIYGLTDPSKSGSYGQPAASTTAELIKAAKELGIDPNNFSKTTTGTYGTKTTGLDRQALYNAIDNQTKDLYLVSNTLDRSKTPANKSSIHASILFKSDGQGNLKPVTDDKGNVSATYYKGVDVTHEGANLSQYAIPAAMVAAAYFGPQIMSAISDAGVSAGTLDAAGSSAGLDAAGATLVGQSSGDLFTQIGKNLLSTYIRSEIGKKYGGLAAAGAGMAAGQLGINTASPYKTIASSFDTGGDTTAALPTDQVAAGGGVTQDDTFGAGQGSVSYVDEFGNPITTGTTNINDLTGDIMDTGTVSTGASGFPLNTDILSSAATSSVANPDNTVTHTFDDGSSITTDQSGNVVDTSTGNVSTGASGFPLNTDNLQKYSTSQIQNADGTTTFKFYDGSTITSDNSGNVTGSTGGIDSIGGSIGGGGTSGGGTKTGGGGTGGGGGGGITGGTTDWSKLLSGLTGYQAAGSAAQAAAAIYAANKQAEAAKYAQDLQQKRFDLINAQYAPQRGAGYSALNQIRSMLPGQYQQYDETGKPIGMGTGTDYFTHQFTPQDLYAGLAPNYQFMLGQGLQTAQRQANLAGGALGGNAQRALQQYTQDYAGNAYQNAFQNYQTQRGNIYNTLAGIAGIGQTAQNTTAQAGQNATNAISQLGVGSAAAQAAGITGAANAIAGGLQNYGINPVLAQVLSQNQNVAQNPIG